MFTVSSVRSFASPDVECSAFTFDDVNRRHVLSSFSDLFGCDAGITSDSGAVLARESIGCARESGECDIEFHLVTDGLVNGTSHPAPNEKFSLLGAEMARQSNLDFQPGHSTRPRGHDFLDRAAHPRNIQPARIRSDADYRHHTIERRGRQQVGRREGFTLPLIVDRRIGYKRRSRWYVSRSASKSAIVDGFDSNQYLTSENRVRQLIRILRAAAIRTAQVEWVLADHAQLVR